MSWNGKKVLVTGAGGFIGSHLAERLVKESADVRAMVHYNALGKWGWLDHSDYRNEMTVLSGDICDRDSVKAAAKNIDVIFHLAALIAIPYSYQAPGSYLRTNAEGTLNILEAARELETEHVLITSTSEVYGTALYVPIDEKHPLQGQSPYSASKIGADKLGESYYCSFNLPVTTVRPFNTFGPRQSARAVIPSIISQCLAGMDEIRLGSLTPRRDMNFVENTIDGFLAAGASKNAIGKVVNFGSNREISIGDLAQLIIQLTNSSAIIAHETDRVRPEKSEVERLLADNTLAVELFGWTPRIDLEEGLARTIEWTKENLHTHRIGRYAV